MKLEAAFLAVCALAFSTTASARTSLAGPQTAQIPVGAATLSESYEVYQDADRVFVSYHLTPSASNFGLDVTRNWDASAGGCVNLVANAPIGAPRAAADHVLRVAACSSGLHDRKIRISMNHYVRAIVAPGTVDDHEEVSPLLIETEFSLGPGAQPLSPTRFTTLSNQSAYDGVIDLGEGYELRHVDYYYADNNTHRFTFEAWGPRGRIGGFTYDGVDRPWESRISTIQFDGHTLYFAFSNWADQRADLHYAWR